MKLDEAMKICAGITRSEAGINVSMGTRPATAINVVLTELARHLRHNKFEPPLNIAGRLCCCECLQPITRIDSANVCTFCGKRILWG